MATSSKDNRFAQRLENAVDSLLDRITKHAKIAIDIDGDKERNHKKIKNVAKAILEYQSRNFMERINIRELWKIAGEWRTHMERTLKSDLEHYATPSELWSRPVLPKPIPELYMMYDLNIIECLIVITWCKVISGDLVYDLSKEPAEEVKKLIIGPMRDKFNVIPNVFKTPWNLSHVAQLVDVTHQLNHWVISCINSDAGYRNVQIPKVNIPFHKLLRPYSPLSGTSKSSDHDIDYTEPIVRKELTQTHLEEIER